MAKSGVTDNGSHHFNVDVPMDQPDLLELPSGIPLAPDKPGGQPDKNSENAKRPAKHPAKPASKKVPQSQPRKADVLGHRARLRQRLLEGGAEALADYEVLEYLLFAANPRGDTKPLAKALLARFGSLAQVLNADTGALLAMKGLGKTGTAALKAVALATRRMARSELTEQPILSNWQTLIDYLKVDMAHLKVERVRVLYLDTRNKLIRDHHVSDGSIDQAAVYPREIIKLGLDLGASAIILVHNHPSGNPEPSQADIQITHRIAEAGQLLGITVHDHVIISRTGSTSLRAKGLI